MDYIIVLLIAFGASLSTFFSGFGLGTMLTPALVLFFPIEMAVASAAIVHLFSNAFKFLVVGKHAVKRIVLGFGLPAIGGALVGAALLAWLGRIDTGSGIRVVTGLESSYLKITIGALIVVFSLMELVPLGALSRFGNRWLVPGGVISGFFGGLSGHQGALRSLFLQSVPFSKEQVIASGIAIACMVDIMRIGTYALSFDFAVASDFYAMLVLSTVAAISGALFGNRILAMTNTLVQPLFGLIMMLIGLLLIMGVI